MVTFGDAPSSIKDNYEFKWTDTSMRYLALGFHQTMGNYMLWTTPPVISQITEDLDHWMPLPICLAGQVASVKMNVLPRLVYPFSMHPVKIPAKTFTWLNAAIGTFLRENKEARIKKLQLFKKLGGLGLPNIKSYYCAAQLNHIASRIQQPKDLSWIEIESQYCEMPLHCHLFIADPISIDRIKRNYYSNIEDMESGSMPI
jgi:hypothetical protein